MQKNSVQLELFDLKTGKPVDATVSTGADHLSRLREQHGLTSKLLEEVVEYENIIKAYERVVSNKGSSGVDGMEVSALKDWLPSNLEDFRQSILTGSYQVSAVLKVEIPKPNGGIRTLGIPTVLDRLVQQMLHQVLNRYYDRHFSEHSYGFRPGRSAHDAIGQASTYVSEGYNWVVEIDLASFFDTVNHDRLRSRLSKGIGDLRVVSLINQFLQAGMMSGGIETQRSHGVPQGGPLSPLLSNIILDELDKELEKRGHRFCRYADDCNIYVGSRKAGLRVLSTMTKFIEEKLKLRVNRDKSGVYKSDETNYLGYTVMEGGEVRISDKSVKQFKDKVRQITKRNRGVEFTRVIAELNSLIRGVGNYFRLTNAWLKRICTLDGWVRRRLRCYLLKQKGRKYTIFKFLNQFSDKVSKIWNAIMYSQGWWQLTAYPIVGQSLSIRWFAQQGLLSLSDRMTKS